LDRFVCPLFHRYFIYKAKYILAQCTSDAGLYGIQYGIVQDEDNWNLALFHYMERDSIAIIRTTTYEVIDGKYQQKHATL
jgi:hypothetical protein